MSPHFSLRERALLFNLLLITKPTGVETSSASVGTKAHVTPVLTEPPLLFHVLHYRATTEKCTGWLEVYYCVYYCVFFRVKAESFFHTNL